MKLIIAVLATALFGMIGVSSAVIGYFIRNSRIWERIVLFGAGFMLIIPELLSSAIGLVLIVLIWFIQRRRPEDEAEAEEITKVVPA